MKVFNSIEFEVEHPLYLARIVRMQTGRTGRVLVNEFEATQVPIEAILVKYIPKFDRIGYAGGPITTEDQAYRVLYQVMIWVGESNNFNEIMQLTERAQQLAEANPDPVTWKEDEHLEN